MSAQAAVESGRVLLYLGAVWDLQGEGNPARFIRSAEIGEAALVHPTQVRRDLSLILGKVGRRGSGYHVSVLEDALLAVALRGLGELQDAARKAEKQADLMGETLDRLSAP